MLLRWCLLTTPDLRQEFQTKIHTPKMAPSISQTKSQMASQQLQFSSSLGGTQIPVSQQASPSPCLGGPDSVSKQKACTEFLENFPSSPARSQVATSRMQPKMAISSRTALASYSRVSTHTASFLPSRHVSFALFPPIGALPRGCHL